MLIVVETLHGECPDDSSYVDTILNYNGDLSFENIQKLIEKESIIYDEIAKDYWTQFNKHDTETNDEEELKFSTVIDFMEYLKVFDLEIQKVKDKIGYNLPEFGNWFCERNKDFTLVQWKHMFVRFPKSENL